MKLFALTALVVPLLCAVPSSSAAQTVATLALGAAAPAFDLPGVDGRNWKLDDFASAKALVVVFTCNHCPTAQYYEERLKQFAADYRGKGVAFVAIMPNDPESVRLDELGWSDMGDSFEDMKIRARDRGFNFPYLRDETQEIARAYGATHTPHVFLLDAQGVLRYQGAIDDNYEDPGSVEFAFLRDALDAVLDGKTPKVTVTDAVGCTIKWK